MSIAVPGYHRAVDEPAHTQPRFCQRLVVSLRYHPQRLYAGDHGFADGTCPSHLRRRSKRWHQWSSSRVLKSVTVLYEKLPRRWSCRSTRDRLVRRAEPIFQPMRIRRLCRCRNGCILFINQPTLVEFHRHFRHVTPKRSDTSGHFLVQIIGDVDHGSHGSSVLHRGTHVNLAGWHWPSTPSRNPASC